jgi:FKBP-type peptidyl-prolyl cis-trans isomerase
MVSRLALPALVVMAAVAAAGCFEKLSGPGCVAKSWDIASTSGDTVTTTRGLRYIARDTGVGNGAAWCRSVAVHYNAYLLNGTKFDSSVDIGRALVFTPGGGTLIDGFEQGVIGVRSCGSRRLIIPPELGYGANVVHGDSGQVIVPANSTLVFDIRMLEIGGEPVVVCDSTAP